MSFETPAALVAVSVELDGQPAPLFPAPDGSGRFYVEARRSCRYSVALANRIAPEHTEVLTENPERVLDRLTAPDRAANIPEFVNAAQIVATSLAQVAADVLGLTPDEVEVVLDGLQIHDPYHLRQFYRAISIIDSEVIGGVDLLTGGFPIEYGDRMSGVVDLSTTVPNAPLPIFWMNL